MQSGLVRSLSATKGNKIELTDPRVSGGCGRRRRPRAAAGRRPVGGLRPRCRARTRRRDSKYLPAWKPAPAHIAGLASARAPAKGTILKNVRQTLTTAAITAVLATAPLTLTNAIAFADTSGVGTRTRRGMPFEPAGFVPTPDADAPADAAPAAPPGRGACARCAQRCAGRRPSPGPGRPSAGPGSARPRTGCARARMHAAGRMRLRPRRLHPPMTHPPRSRVRRP